MQCIESALCKGDIALVKRTQSSKVTNQSTNLQIAFRVFLAYLQIVILHNYSELLSLNSDSHTSLFHGFLLNCSDSKLTCLAAESQYSKLGAENGIN